jgi:hypothetical protein
MLASSGSGGDVDTHLIAERLAVIPGRGRRTVLRREFNNK